MTTLQVLSRDAVFAAVSPSDAIAHTREAFVRHHRGEWSMPSKVYLQSPPYGDFRAMPALGGDLAMLKWISSFPGNRDRTDPPLPTVMGLVCLSDARTSEPLLLLDAGAVTALRTGAVAAIAARALARADARSVAVFGCGLHGAWAARCLVADGYGGTGTRGDSILVDPREEVAAALAAELGEGWRVGSRLEALDCDVICCVTPGHELVLDVKDLRPGRHLNMLGADGPGKAEMSVGAVASCALFCDEWAQASHGGELTGAVEAGMVRREQVTDLGAVLCGESPGRRGPEAVTLFDSTGLAIQDLAIAAAALEALREGRVQAQTVEL